MSVFIPDILIQIGDLRPLSSVRSVEVRSSWQQLTDTCSIEMPRNVRVRIDKQTLTQLNNYIRKGDAVTVSAGYAPRRRREFQGFVRSVGKGVPLQIECEDYSYLFKLDSYSMSWASATLKDVVDHILTGANLQERRAAGFDFNVSLVDPGAELGKFAIRNLSGAQVLQHIKDVYGLVSYFETDPDGLEPPTLVVGFPYNRAAPSTVPQLEHGANVANWSLEYRNAEDVKVRIKAISNLKNGKKRIVEVGDPEGELHTRNYPEISLAQLRSYAEDELKNSKRDGFAGAITAFGTPYIRHGDVLQVDDPVYTRESGRYFVDATTWQFSEAPSIRRQVTLGLQAAS